MNTEETLEEALRAIDTAKSAGIKILNFSNMQLADDQLQIIISKINTEIPKLESLNLSQNNLTSIPKEIGKLKHLNELFLNNNKLKTLPKEIGGLQGLESLSLENNELTKLPNNFFSFNNFFSLTNLKRLNLSNNQLSEIPKEIIQLKKLTYLNLDKNRIINLPEGLIRFVLEKQINIEVTNNPLSEETIATMYNTLGEENSKISRAVAVLINTINDAQKEKYDDLVFSSFGLTDEELQLLLPIIIKKLPNLKHLNLKNNLLTKIPDAIMQLKNLEILQLNNNQLTNIPDGIGKLINLKELHLMQNQLTNIPDGIGKLINLKELHLNYNQLTNIPDGIGKLINLNKLHLNHNFLTNIPDGIGKLINLKELHLHRTRITSIPNEIGNLPELRLLDLNSTRITDFTNFLGSNLNLQLEIDLTNNRLTHETISQINLTALSRRVYFDMSAYDTEENNNTTIINQIYGNRSYEIQNRINNLVKKEYSISNGTSSNLKTGAFVINDFLTKATSNLSPALSDMHTIIIKQYLDKALDDDKITRDTALNEMATALGNCPTPVHNLILNKAIILNQEDPLLFAKFPLEVIIEKKALEDYLEKKFEPFQKSNIAEHIEAMNGLLNAVYLQGAENMPKNKIKISQEGRKLLPSTTRFHEIGFHLVHKAWIVPFAKICCKTDEGGNPILKDKKYELDQQKLNVIKQQYMIDNNLVDSATLVSVAVFNRQWNQELAKNEDLFTIMGSLSEENKKRLTPDDEELKTLLENKKDGETNEKIVGDHFKKYSDNILIVLQSNEYKDALSSLHFNTKCEDTLVNYPDLVNVKHSLSESLKQLLDPDEIGIDELLANKKVGETNEKIVDDSLKKYSDNILIVLQSKEYKDALHTFNTQNTQQPQILEKTKTAIEENSETVHNKTNNEESFSFNAGGLVYNFNKDGHDLEDPDLAYASDFIAKQSRIAKLCDALHYVPVLGFLSPVIRTLFLASGTIGSGRFAREFVLGIIPFGGLIYRAYKLQNLPKRSSDIYQLVLQKRKTEIVLNQKLKAASILEKLLTNKGNLEDAYDAKMAAEIININDKVAPYIKVHTTKDAENQLMENTSFTDSYSNLLDGLSEELSELDDKAKLDKIKEMDINSESLECIKVLLEKVANKTAKRELSKNLDVIKSELAWAKCIDYVNGKIGTNEPKFEAAALSKATISDMKIWLKPKTIDYKDAILEHLNKYLDYYDTKTELTTRAPKLEVLKVKESVTAWNTYQDIVNLEKELDKFDLKQRKAVAFKEDFFTREKMGIKAYDPTIASLVSKDDKQSKDNIELLKNMNQYVLNNNYSDEEKHAIQNSYEALLRPGGQVKNNKDEQTTYLQQVTKKYAKRHSPRPSKEDNSKKLLAFSLPTIRRVSQSALPNSANILSNQHNRRIRA